MGALLLLRHGQASFGQANYDVLSDRGRAQAGLLGRRLAHRVKPVTRWMSGSLQRQQDTALLLREALSAALAAPDPSGMDRADRASDRVRNQGERTADALPALEIHAGMNEFDHLAITQAIVPVLAREDAIIEDFLAGRTDRRKGFQAVFEKVVAAWSQRAWPDADFESWTDFRQRIARTLAQLCRETPSGETTAVITSGGPIMVAVMDVLGLSVEAAFRLNWSIVNASATELVFDTRQDRRALLYFNDFSHLEQAGSDWVTWR